MPAVQPPALPAFREMSTFPGAALYLMMRINLRLCWNQNSGLVAERPGALSSYWQSMGLDRPSWRQPVNQPFIIS